MLHERGACIRTTIPQPCTLSSFSDLQLLLALQGTSFRGHLRHSSSSAPPHTNTTNTKQPSSSPASSRVSCAFPCLSMLLGGDFIASASNQLLVPFLRHFRSNQESGSWRSGENATLAWATSCSTTVHQHIRLQSCPSGEIAWQAPEGRFRYKTTGFSEFSHCFTVTRARRLGVTLCPPDFGRTQSKEEG